MQTEHEDDDEEEDEAEAQEDSEDYNVAAVARTPSAADDLEARMEGLFARFEKRAMQALNVQAGATRAAVATAVASVAKPATQSADAQKPKPTGQGAAGVGTAHPDRAKPADA